MQGNVTGQAGIGADYLDAAMEATDRTTVVTVVLVVVILLIIYRAPLAALAPLLTIGIAWVVARGVLGWLAQAGWQVSSMLDTFMVVLVFGVGTDYSIFLISRVREELAHDEWAGADPPGRGAHRRGDHRQRRHRHRGPVVHGGGPLRDDPQRGPGPGRGHRR